MQVTSASSSCRIHSIVEWETVVEAVAKLTNLPAASKASFSKASGSDEDTTCAIIGTTRNFQQEASERIAHLTLRQIEVLDLVLAGYSSKKIAYTLHINPRTVDNHRAAIAQRIGTASLPELVHVANCGRCSLQRDSATNCTNVSGEMLTDMKEFNTASRTWLPSSSRYHARLCANAPRLPTLTSASVHGSRLLADLWMD
jgi:DNA-binding CsgD family transcriptional regulator